MLINLNLIEIEISLISTFSNSLLFYKQKYTFLNRKQLEYPELIITVTLSITVHEATNKVQLCIY